MSSIRSRRAFLQTLALQGLGMGAMGALLGRSSPAHAGQSEPRRLVIVSWANGVQSSTFWPTPGKLAQVNAWREITSPLAPIWENVCVLRGLTNPAAPASNLTGHETYLTLLSGAKASPLGGANAPTIDQLVARSIGSTGAFESLQLGVYSDSQRWVECMSWRDQDAPLFAMSDPADAFTSVFGGEKLAEVRDLWANRRRVLGMSQRELAALPDIPILDQHESAVSELMGQFDPSRIPNPQCYLQHQRHQAVSYPRALSSSASFGVQYPYVGKMQRQLLRFAMECGVTQVATLQYGDSHMDAYTIGADNEMGIPVDDPSANLNIHMDIAHDGENPLGHQRQKTAYDKFHVQEFADLVSSFRNTSYGDGSLLDNTLFVLINSFNNGSSHALDPVPVILAGGSKILPPELISQGTAPWGQAIETNGTLNQLYIWIAKLFGMDLASIGENDYCAGLLPGLPVLTGAS